MGPDAMILVFWMLSFKPAFSLSSFTFIKRLFSPSLRFVLGFFCGSAGKESTCSVGDLGSIPWLRRSPGEGNSYPLQYSGMENSMDCIIQRIRHDWMTFTFTGLSAIRVVSSAYLRLFIFLPAILIPAYASSSLTFHMIYFWHLHDDISAYKSNKQGKQYTALIYSFPNFDPVPRSMSVSNYCFLTCIQVSQEAGKVV